MAIIHEKIEVMNKALAALKESLEVQQKYQREEKKDALMLRITRNSTVQCFEFSFDLFWKLLKFYLEDIEKITVTPSPRILIRECVKIRMFTEEEGIKAMDMLDDRNMTSHIYREAIAMEISEKIPSSYVFMHTIVQRLKEQIKQ